MNILDTCLLWGMRFGAYLDHILSMKISNITIFYVI